jgi:hypothetical protein
MIRFAADEDFNNDVVRALRRALPEVNIRGVREAGRGGQPDQRLPIGDVIDDLLLVASCSLATDWINRVSFLPLR